MLLESTLPSCCFPNSELNQSITHVHSIFVWEEWSGQGRIREYSDILINRALFFNSFILVFRERGKQEREKHHCESTTSMAVSCIHPNRDQATTLACVLDWESNQQPPGALDDAQPTKSYMGQCFNLFFNMNALNVKSLSS